MILPFAISVILIFSVCYKEFIVRFLSTDCLVMFDKKLTADFANDAHVFQLSGACFLELSVF